MILTVDKNKNIEQKMHYGYGEMIYLEKISSRMYRKLSAEEFKSMVDDEDRYIVNMYVTLENELKKRKTYNTGYMKDKNGTLYSNLFLDRTWKKEGNIHKLCERNNNKKYSYCCFK